MTTREIAELEAELALLREQKARIDAARRTSGAKREPVRKPLTLWERINAVFRGN
jgi:hypothetical protein